VEDVGIAVVKRIDKFTIYDLIATRDGLSSSADGGAGAGAFMALEADGDCVGLEAFLNSVDGSEEGVSIASYWP